MSDRQTVGNEIHDSDEPVRIRTWQEILRNGEHNKPMKERIDAMTYIKPFPMKEVDLLTVKRFIKFCRFNAKNDWGIGLKILLDFVDSDAKTMLLYDRIISLENEIEGLKTLAIQEEKKDKHKTFGGRKE